MFYRLTYCIIIFISFALLALPPVLASGAPLKPPTQGFTKATMKVKTGAAMLEFDAEIAQTPEQMQYGLMNRTELPDNYAMMFLFPDDRPRAMWMKDTPLPLDMLFIDKHGKILYIKHRATPNSTEEISFSTPARAVIEMPGGTAEKKNIQVGDSIIHPYFIP
jgi:uncharacterized membrane protein (UPF0127 family)